MTEDERKDLFFPLASRVHRKREQVKKRVVYCKDDAASGSREGRKELFFLFFLYSDRTTELTRFRQTQRMCASEHTYKGRRGEIRAEQRRYSKEAASIAGILVKVEQLKRMKEVSTETNECE